MQEVSTRHDHKSYDSNHMDSMFLPQALKTLLPSAMYQFCVGALYRKNERLFLAGKVPQWMFFVTSGEVSLERMGIQGAPVVLQRTRMGFVSEASLRVARYHCDAVAIAETSVIKLPVREVRAVLDEDPGFAARWIGMLNGEVMRLRLHCERLSMKSVKDRVLHLIQTEGKDGHYPVPSGLKTLAGELGVTHEALYRTIGDLQRTGLVSKRDGDLVLHKP
jgi:CRP/FNR family transcriptional regulator, dissimilatory nitrate respiration regulator